MGHTKGKIKLTKQDKFSYSLVSDIGMNIANIKFSGSEERAEGNAKHFFHCVSSHDELIRIVKKARRIARKTKNAVGITLGIHSELCKIDKLLQQAINA